MKTVWIYTNTSKQVGDHDHLKIFEDGEAADRWLAQFDPEGVAFQCEVVSAIDSDQDPIRLPLIVGITGASRDNPAFPMTTSIRPTAIVFLAAEGGRTALLPLDTEALLALHRVTDALIKGFDDPDLPGPLAPLTKQ